MKAEGGEIAHNAVEVIPRGERGGSQLRMVTANVARGGFNEPNERISQITSRKGKKECKARDQLRKKPFLVFLVPFSGVVGRPCSRASFLLARLDCWLSSL